MSDRDLTVPADGVGLGLLLRSGDVGRGSVREARHRRVHGGAGRQNAAVGAGAAGSVEAERAGAAGLLSGAVLGREEGAAGDDELRRLPAEPRQGRSAGAVVLPGHGCRQFRDGDRHAARAVRLGDGAARLRRVESRADIRRHAGRLAWRASRPAAARQGERAFPRWERHGHPADGPLAPTRRRARLDAGRRRHGAGGLREAGPPRAGRANQIEQHRRARPAHRGGSQWK